MTLTLSGVDLLSVRRLRKLYVWNHGYKGMSRRHFLKYHTISEFLPERDRSERFQASDWDFGRVRFFIEQIDAGVELAPIDVDNRCSHGYIYPEPILLDGHHRLVASWVAKQRTIRAWYSGRIDLLEYLRGERLRPPKE